MILKGRVWKFGNNVPSHYFLSGKYDALARALEFEEIVPHVLEDIDPTFVKRVRKGDLIVAGRAFGTGKHLEGLIGALQILGIEAVIAESFSAGWEKDSINAGLAALIYPQIPPNVEQGDLLELDLSATEAKNLTRGISIEVRATAQGIIDILEAGGLAQHTLHRLGLSS